MSFVKNKLKLARDSLNKKDYAVACDAVNQVLEHEPDNYHANVFLGLSLLELGQPEQSEHAYRRAIQLHQEQPLAWQGLSKFYERTTNWDMYANTLSQLMEIYDKTNDAVKCAETWQILVELRREQGTRLQLVEALSLVLPQSPIYTVLSNLPLPNPTQPLSTTTFEAQTAVHNSLPIIEEIVKLLEVQEQDALKKEVERRRTRLGAAGPEAIKREVGREIWSSSKLPSFYNEILNHPDTSDELRRLTDSKLLRYKQQHLLAIPDTSEFVSEKSMLLKEVDELVNGVIILRIADELAWMTFLEGTDNESVHDYDHTLVRQFLKLFPTSSTASLLRGYFAYFDVPIIGEEDRTDDQESPEVVEEDPFDTILNAYSSMPSSLIANRVVAELYINELDYENGIKIAEFGLGLVDKSEAGTGRRLPSIKTQFKVILATSLVHLFPPKHHARALSLIDDVLSQSPDNVACLMGRGYILQEAKRWGDASALFARVDALLHDDIKEGLRAREEVAWCLYQSRDFETAVASLHHVLEILKSLDDQSRDNARCLWRIGQCYWEMDDDKREEAYNYYVRSLKADPAYAPAFTSLGIYYSEFSSPRDPNRASKCFQKAFELDPREADAAKRLAEGFADEEEWDLVEVVARRTIEGEGGLGAGIEGNSAAVTARYLPTNAWAWKAVGAVEFHRRDYTLAIQAFQIALRAEPDDALSWLRLGEAYGKAGRHVAAIKALQCARELQPESWVCTYLIGEAEREMGNFSDAVEAFESILDTRPSEVGVLVSLCRTYLDQGHSEFSEGFQARAERSMATCIYTGLRMIQQSPGFRGMAWKIVADAIYALSNRSLCDEDYIHNILAKVITLIPTELEHLPGFRHPSSSTWNVSQLTKMHILEIAIAAYSYRISLGSSEASAWFDLGICLHSWVTKSTDNEYAAVVKEKVTACLTQALQEDPGNTLYWVGLGHVYFLSNAKMSQHAYIKALEIDSKDAATWSNLGLLYLHHNDIALANEALYRAQTLDPDYVIAWIGQALVATANGHDHEATAMFEHAVTLTASVPEGDFEFASSLFKRIRFTKDDQRNSSDTLLPAFFVLDRYCRSRPEDATALHLFGLVCESLGHFEIGVGLISRAITVLEAVYEDTEDPEVERRFIIANVTLARLSLASRDYSRSCEAYESALGLLQENEDPAMRPLRAQAQFGLGLASFMLGELATALENFEAALESTGDDVGLRGHVTVLLAQTMWAVQTDEFRETSKTQLLECITADPENLMAINTLAGMGVLTNDDNLVDAALSEILALPYDRRHELDPQRDVDYLLTQYHLRQQNYEKGLSVVQRTLFAEPSSAEARNRLATLMLQRGQFTSALAVLSGSTKTDNLKVLPTSLQIQAIARSLSGGEAGDISLQEIQKAIKLSPWNIEHWRGLALIRSVR